MIFSEHNRQKTRNKNRRRRILLSKMLDWALLVGVAIFFGTLGALAYKLILLDREVVRLNQIVRRLDRSAEVVTTSQAAKTAVGQARKITDSKGNVFDVYIVDLNKTPVKIYYKDDGGERLGSFQRLKQYLEEKDETLIFATNGGMFTPEGAPVGLLVVESEEVTPLDLKSGDPNTNFYLKPNGVFALTTREAVVMESTRFNTWRERDSVTFATQSGPMLLTDGAVHPKFGKESSNQNIRSGVGIINSTRVVFAISEKGINFYDFAMMFKQLKCKNALFLDGVISKMYLPALERYELEGEFGPMIAISR